MPCGIYRILNTKTGKSYVGSAYDIEVRWKGCNGHIAMLKRNQHNSIKLQRSFHKHGLEAFEFSILEECSEDQLFFKEAFWIAKLDSVDNGYNMLRMTLDGERVYRHHAKETIPLLVKAGLKTWKLHRNELVRQCLERCATDEFRIKLRKASRAFHDLPEEHPSKVEWRAKLKAKHSSEESRKANSERRKAHCSQPEVREYRRKILQDPAVRAKANASNKGKGWWTNGTDSTTSRECPGPGWYRGRTLKSK